MRPAGPARPQTDAEGLRGLERRQLEEYDVAQFRFEYIHASRLLAGGIAAPDAIASTGLRILLADGLRSRAELFLSGPRDQQRQPGAHHIADEHGRERFAEPGLQGHVPHDAENDPEIRELDHPEPGMERHATRLRAEGPRTVRLQGGPEPVPGPLGDERALEDQHDES